MSIPKDITRKNKALSEWAMLIGYRGSIAHGMYVPNTDPNSIDDKDIMGICIPPIEYYFGLKEFGSRGTKEIFEGEWDIVIYELKKMVSLLKQGNPNVLSLLYLEPEYYVLQTKASDLLLKNRDLFLGKHVYRSFTGYAYSQLHKMESFVFNGYMGDKRKKLVEMFGYDTKNAAHLIRLLRMSIEYLTDGTLYVKRHDATQLLDIKKGHWTLEEVKLEASKLFDRAELAYIKSELPAQPNHDAINELLVNILKEWGY